MTGVEGPRSTRWMEALAERLARQFPQGGPVPGRPGPLPLFWLGLLPRNPWLLAHGFRRLLPPY